MPWSAGNCRFSQPETCSGDHWSASFCATRHRNSEWRAKRQDFGRNARSQALVSASLARSAAATVTPYLSTDSRGRSPEPLRHLPHRLTGRNTTRNLFALIAPQRYPSSAAWRRRNSSVESQYSIDTALVPPLERSGDVRYTLTALPALPELSLLLRREPGPCIHAHTSSSGKIRRCCVDRLRSPGIADIRRSLAARRSDASDP